MNFLLFLKWGEPGAVNLNEGESDRGRQRWLDREQLSLRVLPSYLIDSLCKSLVPFSLLNIGHTIQEPYEQIYVDTQNKDGSPELQPPEKKRRGYQL